MQERGGGKKPKYGRYPVGPTKMTKDKDKDRQRLVLQGYQQEQQRVN